MTQEREEGFYWIRRMSCMVWQVAQYYPSRYGNAGWYMIGTDTYFKDHQIHEVNETRIKYPDEK